MCMRITYVYAPCEYTHRELVSMPGNRTQSVCVCVCVCMYDACEYTHTELVSMPGNRTQSVSVCVHTHERVSVCVCAAHMCGCMYIPCVCMCGCMHVLFYTEE